MKTEVISHLATLLRVAATSRKLVSYKLLHELFDPTVPVAARYDVLERATATICDLRMVDYGVLMTLDNGLPGDDFFSRFKRYRRDEYEAAMGYCSTGRSVIKRRALVVPERQRVFDHASRCARSNNASTNDEIARWRVIECHQKWLAARRTSHPSTIDLSQFRSFVRALLKKSSSCELGVLE